MRAYHRYYKYNSTQEEPVEILSFVQMGPQTVVTDSFHGFTEQSNPSIVAVYAPAAGGNLAWDFVNTFRVTPIDLEG